MPTIDRSSPCVASTTALSRRELLVGAGAGAAALFLDTSAQGQAQPAAGRAVVFTNTTVITVDAVQSDVALAVVGDRIAAIGPTDQILKAYPQAEVYNGRGKALVPGLINCHAHLGATIARGFNEDFGFPNSYALKVQPNSLMSRDEQTLMAVVGALEAIKTGSTTVVENVGNIAPTADALARTGLRWVFAESIRDRENGSGPMSPALTAKAEPPRFSPKLRDDGLRRITDLHSAWHGQHNGRISVFPAATLAEDVSPELMRAVRAFAEKHDLGYTIHLNQSHAEIDFMVKHHGLRPAAFLDKAGFLGPRLFAAHCRYVDEAEIALLGKSRTIVSHQAGMAANRGVSPPIPQLRAAGCTIANGTDNNTTDLFTVMRTALLLERIRRGDDPIPGLAPQPEDILEDATLGGAAAVNQVRTIGSLDIGRKADILVVDTQRIHLVPAVRFLSAWIHNGQPSDIESVMVDGQFVMRDRRILTADEPAIIAEADKVSRRVWAEVQKASPVKVPRLPRKG